MQGSLCYLVPAITEIPIIYVPKINEPYYNAKEGVTDINNTCCQYFTISQASLRFTANVALVLSIASPS